jgi:hypothetical protein
LTVRMTNCCRIFSLLMHHPAASPTEESSLHPLSPEGPDVAISSFRSFQNTPISTSSLKATKQVVGLAPPSHIQAQQEVETSSSISYIANPQGTDSGDELFAKALSPRSPDIPRSPFSFSPEETRPYATTSLNE